MTSSKKPLPVLKILKRAIEIPSLSPALYITALFMSGLLIVVTEIIAGFFFEEWNGFIAFIYFLVYSLLFTLFAITSHRLILIGEHSVPSYGVLSWSKRESKFLGWTVVSYIVAFGAFLLAGIPFFVFFVLLDINSIFSVFLIYLAFIPGLYYFSRISFLFPGCAIEEEMSIKRAMDMTEGNGWRLTFLIMLIPIVFGISFDWLNGYFWLLDIIISIIGVIILLYEIAVLSLSFKFILNDSDGF